MSDIQDAVLYKLGLIEASLDEIKSSQDDAKQALETHAKNDNELFQSYGMRLLSLELSRAKAIGGAAAVSGIVGTVAAILVKTLHIA